MSATTGPIVLPQRFRAPMFATRHEPPLDAEELNRVKGAIERLEAAPEPVPAAPVTEGSPMFDALDAQWHGTGPQPGSFPYPAPVEEAAPAAAPEPPAAEPFPGWLRGFLVSLIDDAAYGVGEALDKPCPLDQHAQTGWCEHCQDLYERAGRYARLQELLLATPAGDSAAAVRTLLAEGWR
jgi:hypothetical protein